MASGVKANTLALVDHALGRRGARQRAGRQTMILLPAAFVAHFARCTSTLYVCGSKGRNPGEGCRRIDKYGRPTAPRLKTAAGTATTPAVVPKKNNR